MILMNGLKALANPMRLRVLELLKTPAAFDGPCGDDGRPSEVSRVSVGADEEPHWIALDPSGQRIVLNSGGRGNRLFIVDFDPANGRLSLDQRFRDPGSSSAGILLRGTNWPPGFTGNVIPHGAVFSR